MAGAMDEQGVTPYTGFWQQALRALAPAHPRTGDVTLALQPDRSRYEAGHRIVLHAQYKSDRPLPTPTISSTVTLPDQKQMPLSFEPAPATPNSYRAEFEPSLSGQYKIAGNIMSGGKVAADTITAIDVEPAQSETTSTRIDEANLARIAAGTGGKFIHPGDRSTWPTADKISSASFEQTTRVDLWGNLSLLIVLCLFLGIDWLIRLLRGYT